MIFRFHIMAPSSFKPDHQVGTVLAHVEADLARRQEVVERKSDRLILAGVSGTGWHGGFTGRGLVAFERQPPPGRFTIRLSVVREALITSAVFTVGAVYGWLSGRPTRVALIAAAFALGACVAWSMWGLYKAALLRRLLRRGIAQVAA